MAAASFQMSQQAKSFLGYGSLLGAVVIAYLLIRAYGDTLSAPMQVVPAGVGASAPLIHVNDFLHVLLALVLVIASARTLGAIFGLVRQPPVVGEMIAGILLGPSLLGHIAPHFSAYILPHSVAPLLNVISQVGVILYMFLVGLDLDISLLKTRAQATITISHVSIVTPFLLGAGLALLLYPKLSTNNVSFTAFSLFLGVSMSVTAFPVLARILSDRGIQKTQMGTLTLACAAIDDVSAWCLLAFVVSVTQSQGGHALSTLFMALVYIAVMLVITRPVVIRLTRLVDNKGRLTQGAFAVVLLAILLSSLATESIGIHSIFGAFVLGAIIPHGSLLARDLINKLEDFVIVFLLPAFFAFTGLRTQIGLVSGAQQWLFCGLIVVVASLGKFGGSTLAARFSGLGWRDASALGVLMNTRGLMELIVLNIGLELRVISPTLFAMLVLMALATTLATTPILHFIMPQQKLKEEVSAIEAASRAAVAPSERSGTLVPISNADGVAGLLDIALSVTPPEAPPPRVLAMVSGAAQMRPGLGLAEDLQPSRSPLLAAALDAAWSLGSVITPKAVRTTNAAAEIISAAEEARVRWLLLESRRSILGKYPRRSIVSKVLERAFPLSFNVAVLVQSSEPVRGPVTCLADGRRDGASALELATHVARSRGEHLSVLLVTSRVGSNQHPASLATRREWQNELAYNGDTTSVIVSTAQQLIEAVPKGMVIIAKDVLDGWQIVFDQLMKGRNIVVVQGASTEAIEASQASAQWQPVTV